MGSMEGKPSGSVPLKQCCGAGAGGAGAGGAEIILDLEPDPK